MTASLQAALHFLYCHHGALAIPRDCNAKCRVSIGGLQKSAGDGGRRFETLLPCCRPPAGLGVYLWECQRGRVWHVCGVLMKNFLDNAVASRQARGVWCVRRRGGAAPAHEGGKDDQHLPPPAPRLPPLKSEGREAIATCYRPARPMLTPPKEPSRGLTPGTGG